MRDEEGGDRPLTAPTPEPDLPLPTRSLAVLVPLTFLNRVFLPTARVPAVPPVHTFAIL